MARFNVYRCDKDKEKFLEILCKACRIYKVNIHDYCLMDNHYHILLETTAGNLSLFMRQVKPLVWQILHEKKTEPSRMPRDRQS